MNKNIPNSVCWNITNRCNDNCLFCYRDINTKEISFEKQKKIIDAIASTGIYKLTFAGGEPLLVKNIQQLILYAKDKGLNVSLTTNGIILNGGLLEFCLKELDWLTLPMDSYYEKGQSKMSRNPNHFKKIYKILDFANDYSKRNCKIKINTVVSNINKEDIKYIAHIIDEKNINRWKLFQFVPLRDSAKENSKIFEIKSEDFYKSVDDAKKVLGNKNKCISICDKKNIECGHFVIFPDGSIKISNDLKDCIIGNAITDDLSTIWNDGKYNKDIHEKRTRNIYI